MAALCAATAIIAVVVPFAAGLSLLGTVPMGLLAYRYRLRVLIAATVAGGTIAFHLRHAWWPLAGPLAAHPSVSESRRLTATSGCVSGP